MHWGAEIHNCLQSKTCSHTLVNLINVTKLLFHGSQNGFEMLHLQGK